MAAAVELVTDWAVFHKRFEVDPSRVACRLAGEIFPFHVPVIDRLRCLDEARRNTASRILSQKPDVKLDPTAVDAERVRRLPLEEAAALPNLHISLFDLADMVKPGGSLEQLNEEVLLPMEKLWHAEGMRWEKFWPVIFITGSRSATNYHADPHATLPLNLFGRKRFWGLKDPERWLPGHELDQMQQKGIIWPTKPAKITSDDCVTHDNAPGDIVYIPVRTPHWVDAGSFSATLTFALPGLRVERKTMVTSSWGRPAAIAVGEARDVP
ncbi:MAG TPA: cupin domain-containing protein [Planctomycetota bacterium]|nr:cupin domain-containing protein [Planctomycetota bacterium]